MIQKTINSINHLPAEGETARLVRFGYCVDLQVWRGAFLRPKDVQLPKAFGFHHFILPGYGHGTRIEFRVEIRIGLIDIDALHGGELFNIEHIFGINGVRLLGGLDWIGK